MSTHNLRANAVALKQNVEDQLSRLVTQLEDLESEREQLDDDEYEEMRKDTLVQLQEFQAQLDKMVKGDMTLVDSLSSVQLAIQAAISGAYKAPEVIRLFAKRDHSSLRDRLGSLQAQQKLGKISEDAYNSQACEVLAAIKKLGAGLSATEEAFLQANRSQAARDFDSATQGLSAGAKANIVNTASAQNLKATGGQ